MIQCCIKRDKDGFSKKFYPKYDIIFSNNGQFIASAQKMQLMRSAHYVVTLDHENMNKTCPGYIGKLRSNLVGTEFNMFDKGENPSAQIDNSQIRCQYGALIYVFCFILL
jgi:tubby-related protein 1